LEIGGGAMSHFDWINAEQMKSYTVSDKMRLYQKKMDALRTRLPSGATLVLHDFEADSMLLSLSGPYTRIIASHVLEHIPDAEAAITKWNALLSPDGIISIALPCDPGWAWQLGRLIAFKGLETGLTLTEYDLVASREHVNSVQRILQIVRYYYRRLSIRWFPMIVPVVDFNLVCVINVSASDHRDRNHRALS
jgi:SAM-dependent methyltransferase